jgi:hypothetical protein
MTDLLPSTAADIERMEGELQALRAELAARNSEFGERIEHQAATIEVLKTMSASPGDAQPVFDLIARQAAKLCNVPDSGGRHVRRNDAASGDTERIRCRICRCLRVTVSSTSRAGLLDGSRNSAPTG